MDTTANEELVLLFVCYVHHSKVWGSGRKLEISAILVLVQTGGGTILEQKLVSHTLGKKGKKIESEYPQKQQKQIESNCIKKNNFFYQLPPTKIEHASMIINIWSQ